MNQITETDNSILQRKSQFYFAPMEGVTGHIFRNAHHTLFGKIDKYFSPFIAVNQTMKFKSREKNDILPANNEGQVLIPQLLTNQAEHFTEAAKQLQQFGYDEINLNLGCPSGTVVSKKKGSGFLAEKEALDRFLEDIFNHAVTKISVKTRIGVNSPEEFYDLIQIFNRYPLEELIVHPRVRSDFYKNQPNLSIFRDAVKLSKIPVCYNGDLFTVSAYRKFVAEFKETERIMIGRGLLINPALIECITENKKLDKRRLSAFHQMLYEAYQKELSGEKNILFKMKEMWLYLIHIFAESEKYEKKIKKVQTLKEYVKIIEDLFTEKEIADL